MPELSEFTQGDDGQSVKFSVIGGSIIKIHEAAGKTIAQICEQQGQPTEGMQAVVYGKRVPFDTILEGGESICIVTKVTGNC